MTSDPPKAEKNGPSTEVDPGDRHSGEGLASVRPRLQRTLAESARRNSDRQSEVIASRLPDEPVPEPDANEKSPAATQRG